MKKLPIRVWIAVMIFFTTYTNYMTRVNISVSIIEMVDRQKKSFDPPCKKNTSTSEKKNETKEVDKSDKYSWSENEVGTILSAYFWGYIITSMPGGILAEQVGPWHTILWSSVVVTVLSALTPLSARAGSFGVVVNRFLIGAFGGVVYPAVNVLIAKWAPPKEKGRFLGAMMGNTLGTVITFNMVGLVTAQFGWPWGFHAVAIMMAVYCVAFALVVADSPHKHRWISEEETAYITEMQGSHVSKQKKIPPYKKILTSIPFWVCCIAQFGNLWGLNLSVSYAPKFMSEVLGFNLKASAGLAALPNLARLICSNIFGFIGDKMVKKEIMPLTKCRKFFVIFSHFIPAVCLVLMRAAGCSHVGVVALLIMNQGFNGAVVVSTLINPQDLAPNFAGTVYGMMNTFGMLTGSIVPMITGALNDYYNMGFSAATAIFTIGAAVLATCGAIFILFGQSTVQPWNEIKVAEQPQAPQEPKESKETTS